MFRSQTRCASREVAGPWKPTATNIPGIQICEAFPRLAQMMDKLAIVRSLVGNQADHDAIQVYNGHNPRKPTPAGGWPQFGSAVAKLQGAVDRAIPPFISLCYTCTHGPYNEPGPGFLGSALAPFRPMGPSRNDMVLQSISVDRMADRKTLLKSFDTVRREVDASGAMKGMDAFTEQAFGLLTSSRIAEALDLSREPVKMVERYGTGNTKIHMDGNGAPRVPQSLLMARRLIEAGARIVTLNYSKWDWHGGKNAEGRADNSIFLREAEDFPVFDRCVSRSCGRSAPARTRSGLFGGHHGGIRTHAEDQRTGWPRSLATGELCAARWRWNEDGASHWRN